MWDGPTITISGSRGEEWEHAVGMRTFPILEPSTGNCELGPPDRSKVPCFMLAISALTSEQQSRIIDHLARRFGNPREAVARDMFTIGIPIRDGQDIQVSVPATWVPRRKLVNGDAYDMRFFT